MLDIPNIINICIVGSPWVFSLVQLWRAEVINKNAQKDNEKTRAEIKKLREELADQYAKVEKEEDDKQYEYTMGVNQVLSDMSSKEAKEFTKQVNYAHSTLKDLLLSENEDPEKAIEKYEDFKNTLNTVITKLIETAAANDKTYFVQRYINAQDELSNLQ